MALGNSLLQPQILVLIGNNYEVLEIKGNYYISWCLGSHNS